MENSSKNFTLEKTDLALKTAGDKGEQKPFL